MRTAVTLDADTERLLRSAMHARDVGFKTAINDSMHRGFRDHAGDAAPRFAVMAKAMHLKAGLDPSRTHDADAALEVAAFKTLTTRLVRGQKTR
jgi:hypothetical protein